jgi:hypothetical protein
MKGSDRTILIVLPLLAAVVGVWLLVISPKRSESSELQTKIGSLQASLSAADQEAATAEQARKEFSDNYSALVDLGAAAPADNDQATLLYGLSSIANDNAVRFSGFNLDDTAASASAAPPPAAAPTDTSAASTSGSTTTTTPSTGGTAATDTSATAGSTAATSTTASTATTAAPATEAAAATLPLGAAVGPAGLPASSYTFNLSGTYFHALDFMADVDKTVKASEANPPKVHGRLLTVDGFSFSLEEIDNYPTISANYAVTAYAVPPDQGVDAGATPAGPAPVGSTTDTTTTPTPAPTAAVSP